MVQGRGEFEWSQTASILAQQINMNRKKGTPAVKPDELNPFMLKVAPNIMLSVKDSMDILKKAFVK